MFADNGYNSLGFALLDAASAKFQIGCVPEDDNLTSLRTLLARTSPSEVLVSTGTSTRAIRVLKQFGAGMEISKIPNEDLPAPAAAAAVLDSKPQFKAVASVLKNLDEPSKPVEGLSALTGLLEHVARMKLLPLLSTSVQAR